jgi:hypothetical protein
MNVSSQSVLAEEAELIRYELQCFMVRVRSFLARAEVALGRLPPMVKPHVGSESEREVDLYGSLSPRDRPSTSPLHVVPPAVEIEAIVRVVAAVTPVLEIMPELHVLCEDPASSVSMVDQMADSPKASAVPLSPAPPLLESSQTLAYVEREGLDDIAVHSMESIEQVVSVDSDVVVSGVVAPIPGALFAKKLYDFLVCLEADDPGSGKTIGCLLKEREMRNKSKKVGSVNPKEKSSKSKIKKSGALKKASTTA